MARSSNQPHVVVVGPSLESQGGIASVNRTLHEGGFFGRGNDGLAVWLHPSTCDGSIPKRLAFAAVQWLRFAVAARPARWALHAHMAFQGSFWRKAAYIWVTRARGGRIIIQIHPSAFWDYYRAGTPLKRAFMRATLNGATSLVALTSDMQRKLTEIAPDTRSLVIPNPIDLEFQLPRVVRDSSTIAFVGWLVPNKGVFDLVDAVKRLRARHRELRLIFAGSKDDGRLKNHVVEAGLESAVQFPGWLDPAAVQALLSRATVLALPSYSEGVPMAILEALACGTPIVASTVGGIPEVLRDGCNALLVPAGSVDALTAALDRVLSDSDLRERMSSANRDASSAFDGRRVAASLRALYRQALSDE